MNDLNVIEWTTKPKKVRAVQMTRENAEAIHEDERFYTSWIDSGLLRVMGLRGTKYLRPGDWITHTEPDEQGNYYENQVYSTEEARREFDGVPEPEDYDPNQRVLF